MTILDEADHMADLGFLPGVKRIMDRTPKVGQRMLFSATLDNGVDMLVKRYLSNPMTHSVDPAVAPVTTMAHHVFRVDAADKGLIVQELASGLGRTVLFMRTKHQAKKLAKKLTDAGMPAVDLHGNLCQNARERNLAAFCSGDVRVLCATDIAARGIHVDDVEMVIHVDPPAEHKAYLHRSGRTARAGAEGAVVTIATPDQAGEVRTLARQAGINPEVSAIKPGAREITALTGPAAPYVEPAPVPSRSRRATAADDVAAASGGGGSGRGGSSGREVRRRGGSRGSGGSGRPGAHPRRAGARAGSSSAASFSARRAAGADPVPAARPVGSTAGRLTGRATGTGSELAGPSIEKVFPMRLPITLSEIGPRISAGAFILNSGLGKRGADEGTAAGLHGFAAGTYPFLKKVEPKQFAQGLAAAEIGIGALLLAPSCRRPSPAWR